MKTPPPTKLDFEDGKDHSAILEIAFADSENNKQMKYGVCFALYLALALIWSPGFTFTPTVYDEQPADPKPKRTVLRPPPLEVIKPTLTREKKAKKTPMPDLTPEEPEVHIEPDPIEVPDMVTLDDDWAIGIPDDKPQKRESILNEHTQGLEPPVITQRFPAKYPTRGLVMKIQGYVILEAILQEDGTIGDIKVLRGLAKGKLGFEKEAIASLKKWQFIPGRYKGENVNVRMRLKVDFNIR